MEQAKRSCIDVGNNSSVGGGSTIAASNSIEDMLFMAESHAEQNASAASPTPSDTSQGSKGNDDSSNDALVVDCDSPNGGSSTPGKNTSYIYYWCRIQKNIRAKIPLPPPLFNRRSCPVYF